MSRTNVRYATPETPGTPETPEGTKLDAAVLLDAEHPGATPARTALYGSTSAKGVENVRLSIAPRPELTHFLDRHKRVRVAITISDQPSPPTAPSTETIDLTLTYTKAPPPEF